MKGYVARIKTKEGISKINISAPTVLMATKEAGKLGKVLEIRKSYALAFDIKMTISERSIFLERLASMIASKVGVSDALKIIVDSFSGTIRQAAQELLLHIEAGSTIQDAFERSSSRFFPEATVAIIKTGSQGGNIAGALREATQFEQELDRIKRASNKGIVSAIFGFIVGVIVLLSCTLYVAPKMLNSELVKAAEDSLDIDWVITLSSVLTWVAGMTGIVIFICMLMTLIRPALPSQIDRIAVNIPVYKDLALAKRNYIALYGLSVLLNAGLRIEEAFRLASENTGRGELRNDFDRARAAVLTGRSWPNAMKTLHPTDRASLSTAQDRVQISNTIKELSIQYKSMYQQRIESFIPVMQGLSALFLSLSGVVLFGVVFLPLMQVTIGIMQNM